MIAISRCEDYRHDVYDVCVGSALGLVVAQYTYRRYYPALRSRECDVPFAKAGDERGFAKVKDEESVGGAREFELDEFDEEDDEGRESSRPLNGRR